jgi:hypothetical protein
MPINNQQWGKNMHSVCIAYQGVSFSCQTWTEKNQFEPANKNEHRALASCDWVQSPLLFFSLASFVFHASYNPRIHCALARSFTQRALFSLNVPCYNYSASAHKEQNLTIIKPNSIMALAMNFLRSLDTIALTTAPFNPENQTSNQVLHRRSLLQLKEKGDTVNI